MLKLTKIHDYKQDVHWNDKYLGYFYIEIDGYWVYQPDSLIGFWSSHELRSIANKLDEMNKDWNNELLEAMKNDK